MNNVMVTVTVVASLALGSAAGVIGAQQLTTNATVSCTLPSITPPMATKRFGEYSAVPLHTGRAYP